MTRTGDYQSLFTAPPDERLRRFADMRGLYPTRVIRRGPEVRELAAGSPLDVAYAAEGRSFGIDDFMRRYPATGLLVLHHGEVVCERHALGHTAQTQWISFSMAKSITSTLIGAALHDGLIGSLDDPVVQTVPRLRGSAYDGVRIRDVLQMSTGVGWVETYLDPESDRRKLMALQVQERPGLVLDYLAQLPRVAEPGTRFNYNTAETFLLGAILAGAIGRPISRIPVGEDLAAVRHGIGCATGSSNRPTARSSPAAGSARRCATTARFGLFVLGDGMVGGQRVLPNGWMAESTAAGRAHDSRRRRAARLRAARLRLPVVDVPAPGPAPRLRRARHLRAADLCGRRSGGRHRRARRVAGAGARSESAGELCVLRSGDGGAVAPRIRGNRQTYIFSLMPAG